jgi:cytochrome P450
MANIFDYEKDIEACNIKLLDKLRKYAATGEKVKLADLVAAYAYDVMFATTTGQEPSFLDGAPNSNRLLTAMESWKFYSVLSGSYLRFHPWVDRLAKIVLGEKQSLDIVLRHLPDLDTVEQGIVGRVKQSMPHGQEAHGKELLTACVALVTAGSDAVIVHLLTTLHHIYRDPELLRRLRQEIMSAHIYQPPRLNYLLRCKEKLPLLHAVMKETLRLYQPSSGMSYEAPEGGVMLAEKHITEGVSATCTQTSRWSSKLCFTSCRITGVLSS